MEKCLYCQSPSIVEKLNLGLQPIGNRFVANPGNPEFLHPLIIGCCDECGLVQLIDPIEPSELEPRYDWISYNEPEGHLDSLADIIARLPGLSAHSKILGLSYKDSSTLARLNQRGFSATRRIDPAADLAIRSRHTGVESIVPALTVDRAQSMCAGYGKSDVIIARHILEHAQSPRVFLDAITELMHGAGYVIFEVPDCGKIFELCDYSYLWEEHIAYFTQASFENALRKTGFTIIDIRVFPYPVENSLVAIAKLATVAYDSAAHPLTFSKKELSAASRYFKSLPLHTNKIRRYLSGESGNKGAVALLGAGHLACAFINIHGLKDLIAFVIDDDPNKRGLYMPGSHLPIKTLQELNAGEVKSCLMSLSPESEERFMKKNQTVLRTDITFSSILAGSNRSLYNLLDGEKS
jgi:hypothetical protein